MGADACATPCRADQRARQERDAKPGSDGAQDRFQSAELQTAQADDSAPRQDLFEALPVGATGPQDDEAQVRALQSSSNRRIGGRTEQSQFFLEGRSGGEQRMHDGAADKSPFQLTVKHALDQLGCRAGAQHEVDAGMGAGVGSEQR